MIQGGATRAEEAPRSRAATALFFSGGVDSWYSLLRAEQEVGRRIDALLFVQGYDVPLSAPHAPVVLHHLQAGADESGVRLVTIRSNYRRFSDPAVSWDMAHGSGLATAARVLDALDRSGTLPHDVTPGMLSADAILVESIRLMVWEDLLVQLRRRADWHPLAEAVARLIDRTERFERGPSLAHLGDGEGRQLVAAWFRRLARQRLPVALRRRVLAARGTT